MPKQLQLAPNKQENTRSVFFKTISKSKDTDFNKLLINWYKKKAEISNENQEKKQEGQTANSCIETHEASSNVSELVQKFPITTVDPLIPCEFCGKKFQKSSLV